MAERLKLELDREQLDEAQKAVAWCRTCALIDLKRRLLRVRDFSGRQRLEEIFHGRAVFLAGVEAGLESCLNTDGTAGFVAEAIELYRERREQGPVTTGGAKDPECKIIGRILLRELAEGYTRVGGKYNF